MSGALVRSILTWAGDLSVFICLSCLLISKRYMRIPLFTCYLLFLLLGTAFSFGLHQDSDYETFYAFTTFADYIIQIAVIYELAQYTYSFYDGYTSRLRILFLLTGSVALCLAVLIVTLERALVTYNSLLDSLLKADLGFDVIRIVLLLGVLIAARVLRVSARDPVLRIAILLSLYSGAALSFRAIEEIADRFNVITSVFIWSSALQNLLWSALMLELSWHFLKLRFFSKRDSHSVRDRADHKSRGKVEEAS